MSLNARLDQIARELRQKAAVGTVRTYKKGKLVNVEPITIATLMKARKMARRAR